MANLLDVDGSTKGCLLRIVALQMDTGRDVGDAIRGGWRVLAILSSQKSGASARGPFSASVDSPILLADQFRGPGIILPLSQELLAKDGIQGFLLVAVLLAPAGVLLL